MNAILIRPRLTCAILIAAASLGAATQLQAQSAAEPTPDQIRYFEAHIRPLLVEHCYECHSRKADEKAGDLHVDDAASMLAGGSQGPAVVPGKPNQSLLVRAVQYTDPKLQMPPQGKLADQQIDRLREWIRMGAPDPRVANETKSNSATAVDHRQHWAFQVPQTFAGAREVGPTDRDVIDSIARQVALHRGITPAPACDERELIRRLYHDLTGLPPTRPQIEAFVASNRPEKTERLVDRLLASPEFAERFARHWMDVARYADTVGYALGGRERRLKGSERYRDWLIRAFADDLPFDQMVRFQLAADHLDPNNEQGHLDAMGFLTLGRRFLNGLDTTDDRIDVVTRGLLGMTVACARCHDHKFDPIPMADYYSLFGIFNNSQVKADGPSPLMMVDKPNPTDSPILVRGQRGNHGPIATRQFLSVLRRPQEPPFRQGSGRRELAERIVAADNPLTARVFVNRIWMVLIGRPIVDSASDFGVRTQSPPLADLLDELSAEFGQQWSVKQLVRRIVLSRVYAQTSLVPRSDLDPDNQLAAHGNRTRKDFESMRDSMLLVCGCLDQQLGGAPVEIHLTSPVPRRSVYAMIDRQNLPSLFRTFDFASPDAHTPKRFNTTVPQQALYLMNHQQVGALATRLAQRIASQHDDERKQIESAFESVLGRAADDLEQRQCAEFLSRSSRATTAVSWFDPRRAWLYGVSPVNDQDDAREFQRFPHFTGANWQTGEKLPAANQYDWAYLGAENGHPGGRFAVVRRWVAPVAGRVSVSGMVGHRSEHGDGVSLALWIGKDRVWRETQKSNNRPFSGLQGNVAAGESVDFVVSPGADQHHDSFFLRCQIRLESGDGEVYEGDSKADFTGPLEAAEARRLDRLAQLVQTLLLSNEFLFVD